MRRVFPALLGALLTLTALYLLGWRPDSGVPHYPRVTTDSAAVVQGEPSPSPGFVDRALRPVSPPSVVATAPGAARDDVVGFCRAAGWIPPGATPPLPEHATTDTAPDVSAHAAATPPNPAPHSGIPSALRVQPPPVALARSGRTTHRTTDLWLVSSGGDLIRSTHRARPPVSWRVDGDSVIVQGSPWWRWGVRALAPLALCAGGGWLGLETGSRLPLYAGCGIGVAIAVR